MAKAFHLSVEVNSLGPQWNFLLFEASVSAAVQIMETEIVFPGLNKRFRADLKVIKKNTSQWRFWPQSKEEEWEEWLRHAVVIGFTPFYWPTVSGSAGWTSTQECKQNLKDANNQNNNGLRLTHRALERNSGCERSEGRPHLIPLSLEENMHQLTDKRAARHWSE